MISINASVGWLLVAAAVLAGHLRYGWRGVLLALTVTMFWLLLQFTRSLRVLREAAARPVGTVPNAVMFNARLHTGMRLPAVLRLSRSLGHKVSDTPEAFVWADDAGDAVRVALRNGRVSGWTLTRAGGGAP